MEITQFTQMFGDKNCHDLEKLKYKYGADALCQYLGTLEGGFFKELSLCDFSGKNLVYLPSKIHIPVQKLKVFMQRHKGKYGVAAMTDEIASTLSIEQIETSRSSIRQILNGSAPQTESDKKAYGIKLGLDFISDPANTITEEHLYSLYQNSVGNFVEPANSLLPGQHYRHDKVYVVGSQPDGSVLHEGIDHRRLPARMAQLIDFINADDGLDDIVKSIVAHYDLVYLHPYFDGNGRTARLLQMWILIQKGYASSLFLPLSLYINESRAKYYKAFELIARNYKLSGRLDVTPFLEYFIEHVINRLSARHLQADTLGAFQALVEQGGVTQKEEELFHFVLSHYGLESFSTKQLEKEFGSVAYATVLSFVKKMEQKGLLASAKYANRVRYRVKSN